ncbi:hypothetical protein [Streptomyces mirabilis]|uniref:hypothetical protein n=1 Tax=Streptomyces mirabilis TaxID=68239 RepID=UPI0036CCCB95
MTHITHPSFSEYEAGFVRAEQPLRQGDVLEFLAAEEFPNGWERVLGLVVTGNCDLALGKHWGTITYVPALPIDNYVQQFAIPKILTREASQAESNILNYFPAEQARQACKRAAEMMNLGYAIEDIEVLLRDPQGRKEEFRKDLSILQLYQSTASLLEESRGGAIFWSTIDLFNEKYDQVMRLSRGKSKKEKMRTEIRNYLKRLPGDSLYLCNPSPEHHEAYVATLRLVRGIEDQAVALRSVDELHYPTQYRARRVARLGVLYCNQMVQQMAGVFTDIGLPADYERTRDSYVENYIENWRIE